MAEVRSVLLVPLAVLALSACSDRDAVEGNGTSISIDATSTSGEKVEVKSDGETGKVSVRVPGFEGKIDLPKVVLNETNFDIDGVKLPEKARVTSMNIKADETAKSDKAEIILAFTAPGKASDVSAWFLKEFQKADAKVASRADGLSGTTEDGNAFAIKIADGAAGQAQGVITVHTTDTGR